MNAKAVRGKERGLGDISNFFDEFNLSTPLNSVIAG